MVFLLILISCLGISTTPLYASENTQPKPQSRFLINSLVGAGMATADSVICQPFENIKNIVQQAGAKNQPWLAALKNTFASSGMKMFVRGTGSSMVSMLPITSTQVTLNGKFAALLSNHQDAIENDHLKSMVAAASAGAASAILVTPRDLIVAHQGISGISPTAIFKQLHQSGNLHHL